MYAIETHHSVWGIVYARPRALLALHGRRIITLFPPGTTPAAARTASLYHLWSYELGPALTLPALPFAAILVSELSPLGPATGTFAGLAATLVVYLVIRWVLALRAARILAESRSAIITINAYDPGLSRAGDLSPVVHSALAAATRKGCAAIEDELLWQDAWNALPEPEPTPQP